MVLGVVAALIGVAKVRYAKTTVDSWLFRLHYNFTAAFCLLAGIFVTASDFVGDPMQCMDQKGDAPKPMITYCWITSTFTINSTGPDALGIQFSKYHEKTIYAYYQWVPEVLFFQAILFYLPHFLWKSMEGKQVDLLLQDLNKNLFDGDAKKKKENIIKYLKESWGMNVKYSVGYYFCESLNLVNVVAQMFLINTFLGGTFMDYGTRVLNFARENDVTRTDPMIEIFPRRAKCTFRKYGGTGTVETDDYQCVLPQNIISEKVFIVMWFWFIFLAVVSSIQVLWRVALCFSPYLRVRLLSHRANIPTPLKLEQAVRHMQMGDYCLLDNIGHNLDPDNFKDILEGVTKVAEEVNPDAPPPGRYRDLYPTLPMETLPRRRHVDEPDAVIR